jgi:hypothetical protein
VDAPADVVDRAVREAYPFGERKYHPYKVWLATVREWKAERAKLRVFTCGGRSTQRCM